MDQLVMEGETQEFETSFCLPPLAPTQEEPPPDVVLTSTGAILNPTEARTPQNGHLYRALDFGDIPEGHRRSRPLEEKIWLKDHTLINQSYGKELPAGKHFLLLGLNGRVAYALEGPPSLVQKYGDFMDNLACKGVVSSFIVRSRSLATTRACNALKTDFDVIAEHAKLNERAIAKVEQAIRARIEFLRPREVEDPLAAQAPLKLITQVVPEQRVPPVVECHLVGFDKMRREEVGGGAPVGIVASAVVASAAVASAAVASAAVASAASPLDVKSAEATSAEATSAEATTAEATTPTPSPSPPPSCKMYRLWISDNLAPWKATEILYRVNAHSAPSIAFNETHYVVVFQPPNSNSLRLELYALHGVKKTPRTLVKRHDFELPHDLFQHRALMRLSLSKEGIVALCCGTGILVFDAFELVPTPRVITLKGETPQQGIVTVARVHHELNNGKRPATDTWDTEHLPAYLEGVLLLPKQAEVPDPPAWSGTLMVGTLQGEYFGIQWRSGRIIFTEASPAREPIFDVCLSNERVLAQGAMSIMGRFTPLDPERSHDMTYLPSGRLVGFSVCGTLIFVLEQTRGDIVIFSTHTRAMVGGFQLFGDPVFVERKQIVYDLCIVAKPTEITILYPHGLVHHLAFSDKAAREVDTASRKHEQSEKKKKGKK